MGQRTKEEKTIPLLSNEKSPDLPVMDLELDLFIELLWSETEVFLQDIGPNNNPTSNENMNMFFINSLVL